MPWLEKTEKCKASCYCTTTALCFSHHLNFLLGFSRIFSSRLFSLVFSPPGFSLFSFSLFHFPSFIAWLFKSFLGKSYYSGSWKFTTNKKKIVHMAGLERAPFPSPLWPKMLTPLIHLRPLPPPPPNKASNVHSRDLVWCRKKGRNEDSGPDPPWNLPRIPLVEMTWRRFEYLFELFKKAPVGLDPMNPFRLYFIPNRITIFSAFK